MKRSLRPNLTLLFFRGITRFIIVIGLLVLLMHLITGCSSVKKIKKSQVSKHDSTVLVSNVQANARTRDSVGERIAKTIQAGSTIIELDDEDQGGVWYSDSTITREKVNPADYEPTTSITLPGGGQIVTKQRIKSITTSGNVTSDENTKSEVHSKDTSSAAQVKSVSVSNESTSGSSSVKRTNWTVFIISSIIILILVIAGRILYKKFIG